MHNIILYLSCFLSCFIVTTILLGFMDGRYNRTIKKRYVYTVTAICFIAGMAAVNMFNNAFLNFALWILFVGCCSFFLYYDDYNRPLKRVSECEVLIFIIAICESLGVVIADWILIYLHIKIETPVMQFCIETAFSKIILIFLYYIAINRLMRKADMPFTRQQYVFNGIIILYSLIDIIVIADNMARRPSNYLLVLNLGCIVIAALYLLYFIKIIYEKNYLKYEIKLLEKDAEVQYKYYLHQKKEYNRTVRVLHDVNKHIKTIEQLYINGYVEDALKYTKQISEKLQPLIPKQYTDNPILNILLTDKAAIMSEKDIEFVVNADNVDLDFLNSIDITTIFGNLLDNAIQACERADSNRKVVVEIGSYHEMLSIRIKNTFVSVEWKNGLPVSKKGKHHGIGLINVRNSIEKYDGSMRLREDGTIFVADIFLNI